MAVQHLPPTASPDEIASVVARDACVVVDELVSGEEMDRLLGEMSPYMADTPAGPDAFSGRNTRRTGALVARSATARELVMHPIATGTVAQVLGHATNFQLHLTQMIAIGPGQGGQPIHRDQWAFDFFPFPRGYEVQCNTLWAATDFTEANGATRVIPGSHLHEDREQYGIDDTDAAEMVKGSVLFYTGALYHGGGPNTTDETRIGVNITYNVAWLRQEENQYLSVPPEIAKDLDVDLLRMIGYARGAYALGYVDDLRDPIEVLRPDLARSGFGDSTGEEAASAAGVTRA